MGTFCIVGISVDSALSGYHSEFENVYKIIWWSEQEGRTFEIKQSREIVPLKNAYTSSSLWNILCFRKFTFKCSRHRVTWCSSIELFHHSSTSLFDNTFYSLIPTFVFIKKYCPLLTNISKTSHTLKLLKKMSRCQVPAIKGGFNTE